VAGLWCAKNWTNLSGIQKTHENGVVFDEIGPSPFKKYSF